jgi:tetratricopeptide (TPR) repeat protein
LERLSELLIKFNSSNYSKKMARYKLFILFILLIGLGIGCAPKVVHIAEGKYLQVINEHQKAIEYFESFIKQHPDSPYVPEAYYLIGESYERLEQPEQAMASYKHVLDNYLKSPYAALSYRQLGKYSASRGEYEKAIEYYQLAMDVLRSDSNTESCTLAIAQIYQNGLKDDEKALNEYRKLTEKELKNQHITVLAYLNIGRIFKQREEYDKARAAFQIIIDKYSWSSQVSDAKAELEKLGN